MTATPDLLPALLDFVRHGLEARWLAAARAELLAHASGTVLELGAGQGANFGHYPPVVRVIAIEPDPARLAEAAVRAAPRPHFSLLRAVGEALPLSDASVDTVVSTMVLCSVHDLERSLSEVQRVLRPGGAILFFEHVRAPEESREAWSQDMIQPLWGRLSGGCHVNRDTAAHLQTAGFQIQPVRHFRFPIWPARYWILGRGTRI
ncbi:MAG: class I SAM-dependent methyltransferase [Ardenticatenaceae bacterium]|nr:class I SAM-dependent methyltransferase [Ardenticatenaceae bacterium]HBY95594.1 SAM-dependent methyltransferase [Chloroflexota bacterium]